jgi:hypothetical protein
VQLGLDLVEHERDALGAERLLRLRRPAASRVGLAAPVMSTWAAMSSMYCPA